VNPRTEHDVYHERRLLFCMALLVIDLGLVFWAVYLFGRPGAEMMLIPALPAAAMAVAHWMAGLIPARDCTCGLTRVIRK
jgi:hypothetical protein